MASPLYLDKIDDCVDRIIAFAGPEIVLGIPLGIGKPNPLVNALYRRVKADPKLSLRIVTALSLAKPHPHNDLEKRILGPVVERIFGNYPDLDYVVDMGEDRLPPNVEVAEFFMKTAEYLNNKTAQQHYIYSNYSHAARDILIQGINVLAQAVASKRTDGRLSLSLSCNPDLSFDVVETARRDGLKFLCVGMINDALPFMPNDAEVSPDFFDIVVTDPAGTHDLYAPPSAPISLTDYAIGLHCASVIKDGGTLQIGIGSLGDAIAHGLILRNGRNEEFRKLLGDLANGRPSRSAETAPFTEGLYGCSEMLVDGFLQLIHAGIIRREVFSDPVIQRLLNDRRIGPDLSVRTFAALRKEGLVKSPLSKRDVTWLKRAGVFKPEVVWQNGRLIVGETRLSASIDGVKAREVAAHCLEPHLRGGIIMHGGFFIGPRAFYQGLRDLPPETLAKICMGRIGYINELYGQEEIAKLQRRDARFINTTMVVTLLGAASSDTLDSGKVVSGVGGQYNFVAMAHALPGARSILILRSTHHHDGETVSNIVWNYGQTTIPRHLRDIVVTEYGVADLRAQSDSTVVKRLLAICDSRFQDELLAAAKEQGKIAANYEIPESQRQNLPELLQARLQPWRDKGLLPELPFGSDLTEVEVSIIHALRKVKNASEHHPLELLGMFMHGVTRGEQGLEPELDRMGLHYPTDLKEQLMRTLLVGSL